jgi:hypothetical protein
MVFNTTFNNISVISMRSVLLMEETRVPGENQQSAAVRLYIVSKELVSPTSTLAASISAPTAIVEKKKSCYAGHL